VVGRLVSSEVVDAADDRNAERTAGFARDVVGGRSDPGLGGGRTPRIDSVAEMVMAPIAEPIITIRIAITAWGSVAEAWAIPRTRRPSSAAHRLTIAFVWRRRSTAAIATRRTEELRIAGAYARGDHPTPGGPVGESRERIMRSRLVPYSSSPALACIIGARRA
jgi:hypothetical protein